PYLSYQALHPSNIVRSSRKSKNPSHLRSSNVAKFSHQANILHPTKAFFNAFSFYLTYCIAIGRCGAHQLHCRCSWLPHAVSLSVLDNLQQIHRCHIPCRRQLSSTTLCFAWRASSCLHPILGWCSPQSPLRRRLD